MAEAVVGEAGDDVEMSVRYDLPGGAVVVHMYIYTVGANALFDGDSDFFDNRADVAENFIRYAVNIFIMIFGGN